MKNTEASPYAESDEETQAARWGTPSLIQDIRSAFRDTKERREAAHDIVEQSRREWAETYGNWSTCEECGDDLELDK